MKIIDCGEKGFIGVGLSARNSDLNGLPGWRLHSYGYHGDDGKKFKGTAYGGGNRGRAYGPTFTTNDVIGKNNVTIIL